MSDQLSLNDGNIRGVSIVDRMEQAFLDYSMSVIVGRALPDVRDGLKPVQRRILYSMWESGLHPDRPFRKCASAVGEVMKKYHPHGDSSIYDALVRMGQDFSTRELLVDGHGNFGSIDGDPPAAMRYTEARLSKLTMQLIASIDEETVDFTPNYDGYEEEPTVLPARFPNLLVNGATGIAVGMATNIAPHNLGEVIDACLHLIKFPQARLDTIMQKIPAPDFPTGARIIEGEGIREAYETGRGAITVEATATSEMRSGNLPRIIVTEIPFMVNKANLLTKMAALVNEKKLTSIRDLRDESSRDGMRIVIELKRGEDAAKVLDHLYRSTELRTNFNVNFVALVDNAPRTLGLIEALQHYLAHQRIVLTRRTEHRLRKAQERAHILEGLLTALDNLDEVIALIRGSATASDAREGLIVRFDLSDLQSQAILDMRLRRLAAMERLALENEYQELSERIAALRAILADADVLDAVLVDELREIRDTHATPRRSRIVAAGITAEDVLEGGSAAGFEARPVTVTVSASGYVKALADRRSTSPHKHTSDPLAAVVRTDTDTNVLLVTSDGQGYRVDLSGIEVVPPRQRGIAASQLLGTTLDTDVVGAVAILANPVGWSLVTVSEAGTVKRTELSEFADARVRALQAAGTKGGERLVAALLCQDGDDLLLATDTSQVTRFSIDDVRAMGRSASGVAGMNTGTGRVVSATVIRGGTDNGEVVTIARDGTGKRTPLADYPRKGRGGKGVLTGVEATMWCGVASDVHLGGSDGWTVVRPEQLPQRPRSAIGDPVTSTLLHPGVGEVDATALTQPR
ncbi:MAG: DNA gyrase subunit A [Nitriliruptoraceae bacterium]